MDDPKLLEVFLDVQRGLPRQGPGDRRSTQKALSLCSGLPPQPQILDVGCGPGMQTLVLAESCLGTITATDTCEEYLDELRRKAEAASLSDRITVLNSDMANMGFSDDSFDLIWSEGAAYILGIRKALSAWRPFLRTGGYFAFTELVWLDESPAAEAAEFFRNEYPAMNNIPGIRDVIAREDYDLVGDFTLPDEAWWSDYYRPLEAKLDLLKEKYRDDERALEIVSMTELEIDIRRRFGDSYGYHFFIVRK